MLKRFLTSKTVIAIVLAFLVNGLSGITGLLADHPILLMAVNAVISAVGLYGRAVAAGPLVGPTSQK